MTLLFSQLFKFRNLIDSYKIKDFTNKVFFLNLLIDFYILSVCSCTLVYFDYAFNFQYMNTVYHLDYIVQLFKFLPSTVQSIIISHPWGMTIILMALSLFRLLFKRNNILISGLICILFNFYLMSTGLLNSGATVIVANFISYMFLIEIFTYFEKRFSSLVPIKYNLIFVMKCQLCIVYLTAGLVKFMSKIWLNGAATYYIFHNERYFKLPFLLSILDSSDFLLRFTSYAPMFFLATFPILVWTKKYKSVVLLSFIFHGFIAFGMGLKEFMIFPLFDLVLFCNTDTIIIKFRNSFIFNRSRIFYNNCLLKLKKHEKEST